MQHRPRLTLAMLGLLAAAPAGAEPLLARYEVRAAGLLVMQVEARLDLDGPRYAVTTRIRTTGVAAMFSTSDQTTRVEGQWRGATPQPAHYRVEGVWRGGRREVAMDYAGGTPRLAVLDPPNAGEREAVPEALQRDTIDALSALAKLSRSVATTGRCDLQAAVFDGRRRVDYAAHTLGLARLPAGLPWSGEALRCGFEGRLLAGFRTDQDPEEARQPQPATAWMAGVGPGRQPLPVLVELPSRWFGHVRATLVAVGAAPPQDLPAAIARGMAQAPGQQRR